MKDVSIVLSPSNNVAYFKRVFNQLIIRTRYDLSKVELVIVDRSTDDAQQRDTASFIQENSDLCAITHLQCMNGGSLALAMNMAIEVAHSRWFVYLCSHDTYVYDPRWLQYMIGNLSEDDQAVGYRFAACVVPRPNSALQQPHANLKGAAFIGFTEYMKENPYPLNEPFDCCNILREHHCLAQGFLVKKLPRICDLPEQPDAGWHARNKETKRFLIAHGGGLALMS